MNRPGVRKSPGRLGKRTRLGAGRDWRHRLLRHHVPLAVVTAVVLLLFLGLSPFTTGSYPELDMGADGALPQPRSEGSRMDHGPTDMDHGGGETTGTTLGFALPERWSVSRLTVATGYVATELLALTLLIGPANLLLRRRNPVSSYLRVVLHAFFYGALLRTTSPFTLLLIITVITVLIGQAVGIWLWRRRHPRTAAQSPT